ncbi:hypothetical protein MXL46_13195 [Heyndrickxia sporothermodurans]|uniref:Uncharacterized protein n=2 Tax=Heyndrickxia sporothermodurans TaxID=46224 RepID=A0A150KNI1_9BACI|nr:hypothetical protein [Heyndrickxia sporothermodurans]KYC96636.1 hypothetical protein B4102_3538 [Heyndrickxia sporothermodurans]MBL5773034.1 hypothetical protein [Heyndrickxia sporothermodurans]MBL5776506.1 hypothetical protein [Heyndrickxia sporothermodurans]MBL5783606.1 hypothetical protein [Heyndrickxia sporothermodurans]MBL5794258.1 hypothetical protein [Heyndrickxia sporothermodurans]
MEEMKDIQESLKNLPKYSLNTEQKQKILHSLQTKQLPMKRRQYKLPIISFAACLSILFLLIFTQLPISNQPHPQKTLTQLNGQKGKMFTLPDTKQEVLGIENKVGILNVFNHFVAKDERRVAKLMLFFWGNPNALVSKTYRVEAVNQFGEKLLLSEGELSSGLNNEDAHTLTQFSPFPMEGKWQLSFYVDDKLYDEFTLDVLPPFPKTKHYMLNDSPKELIIGKQEQISIESSWKNKKEITVKLVDDKGKVVDQQIFEREEMNYREASSNDLIYFFNGKLTFPKKSIWTLEIDGEKTKFFSN